MSKRIAVVGIGLMGSSLARHLVAAGFPVIVHDVDPAKVDELVKLGAKKAAAPGDIPGQVDVVMLSLPNSHVVDDVLLLARSAVGLLAEAPPTFPAEKIEGAVLADCCRWYEFEIREFDDSQERAEMRAQVVHAGWRRDFFGFNRAKHAVVEAAILATRVHLIPLPEILSEMDRLGLRAIDLKRLWLHQANAGMNRLIAERVLGHEASESESPTVLDTYANTSSAGSIIAFHKHSQDFKAGEKGLICSFGAGYSAGTVFVEKAA